MLDTGTDQTSNYSLLLVPLSTRSFHKTIPLFQPARQTLAVPIIVSCLVISTVLTAIVTVHLQEENKSSNKDSLRQFVTLVVIVKFHITL